MQVKKSLQTPPMSQYCDCCGRENTKVYGKGINFALDHHYDDAGNPIFRGWLCRQCNSGIGYLGDNVTGVFKAVDYLLRSLPEEQNRQFFEMLDMEKDKTVRRLKELNGRPIQRCDPVDPPEQEKRSR